MNDITVIWLLIGVIVGHFIFVFFDIRRLNKAIENQSVERKRAEVEKARHKAVLHEKRAKSIGKSSFIVLMSRSIAEIQRKNLENQANKNDKAG